MGTNGLRVGRDRAAAGRTAAVMCFVGGIATVALELLPRLLGSDKGSPTSIAWTAVGAVIMFGLAQFLRSHPQVMPRTGYTVMCFVAVALTTLTTHLNGNSTFGGLAWFVFPVIFAAAHLGRVVAWIVAVLTLAGSSSIIVSTQTPEVAAADLASMSAVVLMITTALLAAGRHQDRLVERLNEAASSDALTGLATRRVLEQSVELLRTEAGSTAKQRTAPAAGAGLVIVDIDYFKQLNDTHGHPVGDAALVHVAQLVRSVVRSSDTIARIGGDEVAILLPGPKDVAVGRARAIHAVVRENPLAGPAGPIPMTVSIGVAHVLEPQGLECLYTVADVALYEAKLAGRDRAVVGGELDRELVEPGSAQ